MGRRFVAVALLLACAGFVLSPAMPKELSKPDKNTIMLLEFVSANGQVIGSGSIPEMRAPVQKVQFSFKPLRHCTEDGKDYCSADYGEVRTAFFFQSPQPDKQTTFTTPIDLRLDVSFK